MGLIRKEYMEEFTEFLKGLEIEELGLRIEKWRIDIENDRANFFRKGREWRLIRELAIELAIKELKSRGE